MIIIMIMKKQHDMKKKRIEEDELMQMLQQAWDSQKKQVGRYSSLTDEQLYVYVHRAVVDKQEVAKECRRTVWRMALITIITIMPIAVVAAVPAYRAEPLSGIYVENPCPNRTSAVESIDFILQNQ